MSSIQPKTAGFESLRAFQRLRKIGLGIAILATLAACLLVQSAWSHNDGHRDIEAFGWCLLAIGVLGRLWCTLYIGGRKAVSLTTHGPYSLCRNPLYFFSSVAAAGVGAQSGSVSVALAFAVVTVISFHIVILREENYLTSVHGEAYQEYLRSTPRFFPNPGLYHSPEIIEVEPRRLWVTLLDGLVFFAAIPLFEAVEWFQTSGLLHPLWTLY